MDYLHHANMDPREFIIHTAISVIPLRDITKGCGTELVGDSSFEKAMK